MTAAEEAAAQAQLLEDVVATAQRLVKAEKDSSKITPAYIAEKVKLAAAMFASDPPVPLNEAKAVSTLIQRFSHRMGKATTLKDDAGHIDWLNAARKKDWHYWRRYRDYQESKLSDVVVDGLDESTSDVLGLLEDLEGVRHVGIDHLGRPRDPIHALGGGGDARLLALRGMSDALRGAVHLGHARRHLQGAGGDVGGDGHHLLDDLVDVVHEAVEVAGQGGDLRPHPESPQARDLEHPQEVGEAFDAFAAVEDETVAVDRNDLVVPYPKPLSLRLPGTHIKAETAPGELGLRLCPVPATLRAIVVLRRNADWTDPPEITELSTLDAMVAIAPETSSLARLPQPLHYLHDLFQRLRLVAKVTYSDVETLAPLLTELIGPPVGGDR